MRTLSLRTWVARVKHHGQRLLQRRIHHDVLLHRPDLQTLAQQPDQLPLLVQESAVAMRYLRLLGPLAWARFPERDLERNWGIPAIPYAPFVAACLVKINQHFYYMSRLRRYLVEHPALTWILGFPLSASAVFSWGFDVDASLPTHRHFTRILRSLPNEVLQFLLDSTVALLQAELPPDSHVGQAISLDTKHILAWVTENNPKAFVEAGRYDKEQQPAGDPDCRLGCKRKRNQRTAAQDPRKTPHDNPVPANNLQVGEYYWGYATGVVATKIPAWGEFVLAELTQPFNCSDISYFFPLMDRTTRCLGCRPKFGAFDTAFDAFYVYEYFYSEEHTGFAAVPFADRGQHARRHFDPDGLPLCQAGLAMPLMSTYWSRTSLVKHEKGRYSCPLYASHPPHSECPVKHKHWPNGGCVTTMPTGIGARIRHQLDRDTAVYKQIYTQRTATERINSQAVEFGIERPKIRNGQAIANYNSLIYIVINLRALQRVRTKKLAREETSPEASNTL